MNTNEIIESSLAIIDEILDSNKVDFNSFVNIWRFFEKNNNISGELVSYFPLRESILKIIYNEKYKEMIFDRDYILKNYMKFESNVSYLFYPSKGKTKKVYVLFSGLSTHNTFNRYSWFWDKSQKWNSDTAYIFFNDLECSWYCGFNHPKYNDYISIVNKEIINYGLSVKDLVFIGGSMGGYASLSIGLKLNVGSIISINPQININSAQYHHDKQWAENMKKAEKNLLNINDLLLDSDSSIYLEYGKYSADINAVLSIKENLISRNGLTILNSHDGCHHKTNSPSYELIESLVKIFDNHVVSIEYAKNQEIK